MAIQIRRGSDAQWEVGKGNIKAGEPAVALDTQRVFVGVGSGQSVELANKESVDEVDAKTQIHLGVDGTGRFCIITE